MSKIIGIDLGTTNSVVAVMEGDQPKRYRSLAECSHDMANLGLRYGYMVQSMPYDEMVNSIDNVAHSDRLRIHFH